MDMNTYVKVHDLTVTYNRDSQPIFEGLSMELYKGELILLMGPNGGGKSTLIKSIVGLLKPVKGSIEVLGVDPYRDLDIRKAIGYVPQVMDVNIYAPITLWDLVSFGRYPYLGIFKRFSKVDEEIVLDAIKKVGLEDYIDYKVSELSGGQLSRGFIARALAQDPMIYLLDEPFESIDYISEEVVLKVLREEAGRGKLIVLAEHHLSETGYIDRLILFNRGVIADGKPEEILNDKYLEKAYGGVKI